MDRLLSPNFALSEFQDVSSRPLSRADELRAEWWAREVLQPARDRFGPIRVTSYIRHLGDGAHQDGNGVDAVPEDVSVRLLADWLATNKLGTGRPLVQVIDERNHVHAARVLAPGATPGYLSEPVEREYILAAPDPAQLTAADYRLLLLAVGLAGVVIAG